MLVVMFPGQGSQFKGMGKELFDKYVEQTRLASDILGYDLKDLCTNDPHKELAQTRYTQPALYVVNAFQFYELEKGMRPDYLMGHSLGEYNALLAAGAFDFETGLRLVKKRGELMAAAPNGGMAAVLDIDVKELLKFLNENGHDAIDIANYNTPTQTVIAGPQEAIDRVTKAIDRRGIRIIPLFVSSPFHSRYMASAAKQFAEFLRDFEFSQLQIPVMANASARPYESGQVQSLLSDQIANSVRWYEAINYLRVRGFNEFQQVGGTILSKMVDEIKKNVVPERSVEIQKVVADIAEATTQGSNGAIKTNGKTHKAEPEAENAKIAMKLGSKAFKTEYGIIYSYVAGSMFRGISSKELVIRMGKARMLGYLGTGGMTHAEILENIRYIRSHLQSNEAYGMNLLHQPNNPGLEMSTVQLFIDHQIRNVEAAAYMQITPSLVYYRLKGLQRADDGSVTCQNKILAKVSRPEVAEGFMRPAPARIVTRLLEEGLITREEESCSRVVPMSYDICVEADSGGHTDRGVAYVLLPSIQQLRESITAECHYSKEIRIGLAGGIGTPVSVACAFVMGADFVLTGSINQCTVEAGTSKAVKDMLQTINVQDTDYAPAGDMFEVGAKVQVLKKGVLFPARANKLYNLYAQYSGLEEVPQDTIQLLERNYFKKSIDEVWSETMQFFERRGEKAEIEKASQNPKHKMALIFRWYFGYSIRLALAGDLTNKVNFQVHTGPALGAFNQWVKGTPLEAWQNRHVDKIGIELMEETGQLLRNRMLEVSVDNN